MEGVGLVPDDLLTAIARRSGSGALADVLSDPRITGIPSIHRTLGDWQPPAGYVRQADGSVVDASGQVYTPVRGADGNIRTNSAGDPIFSTQSAGSTANITLTKPSTSGGGIGVAPSRTLPAGSPYSQADYDAYVQRKLDAGETPRPPEDYVQRRQQLDQNRADGTRRQEQYRQEMADIHGEENVLTERFLRDANGDVVRDPVTGEGRRLDCVVVNGQCGYAAEVTSPTAPKDRQIEKENNIRDAGGTFVVNPNTGELIEVGNTSDVIRLD
jgi:hypothetical protein